MATARATPVASLTSVFTPPSNCFSTVTLSKDGGFRLGPDPSKEASCYPPLYTPAPNIYYSPARDCPLGWTAATQDSLVYFSTETETRVICCPTNSYVIQTQTNTRWPYYSTMGCTVTDKTVKTTMPVVTVTNGVTKSRAVGAGMNGYSIQLRWRAGDFEDASTTGSQFTPTSTPPPVSSDLSLDSEPQPSSSLSASAKVGIGIGAALGVLALAALALVWWRVRRSRSHEGLPAYEEKKLDEGEWSAPPQELSNANQVSELPGLANARHEANSN